MTNKEKAEILKSTEKLWNERNRLKELVKENVQLKCCANCNDYLASVCKCNKIGEYRICDSICKDWN